MANESLASQSSSTEKYYTCWGESELNQVFEQTVFTDKNYVAKLEALSPEAKFTLTNAMQQLADENKDSLKSGYVIRVDFLRNGDPVVSLANYSTLSLSMEASANLPAGSYKLSANPNDGVTFESDSTSVNIINGSISKDKNTSTHYKYYNDKNDLLTTKPKNEKEANVDLVNLKFETSAKIFGGEASAMLIQADGSAFKLKGNLDIGKIEATFGNSTSIKKDLKFNVELFEGDNKVKMTPFEIGITGSYFQKPTINVDDNYVITIFQKEMGVGYAYAPKVYEADITKKNITVNVGGHELNIVYDKKEIEQKFFLFNDSQYKDFLVKTYQKELDIVNKEIDKYTIANKSQNYGPGSAMDNSKLPGQVPYLYQRRDALNRIMKYADPEAKSILKTTPTIVPDTIVPKSDQMQYRPGKIIANYA